MVGDCLLSTQQKEFACGVSKNFAINFTAMRYTNQLSIITALLLIAVCFAPWVYISPIDTTVTGWNAGKTSLGKPGLMNIIFSSLTILLTLWPGIWAKRINVFICSFNISWSIRNYLLTTQCEMGECPEKKYGIYLLLLLSLLLLVFSFFPQLKITMQEETVAR